VRAWCDERGLPQGALLSLATAWRLAQTWYHDRLDPAWRRKTPEEAQQLFDELGLGSAFWQLRT
jgi:hypothetical protein